MKTIVLLLVIAAGLASARGQGTVNFANTGSFAVAADRAVYIYQAGGAKLTGTNYVAALYFGTTADNLNQFAILSEADPSLASAVGHFRDVDQTTSLAGTWTGGVRLLPGTMVGQDLFLQVWVWDITKFATPADARAGHGDGGNSDVFLYRVPSPGDAAGMKIIGFRGMTVYVQNVPEPSTLVLGAIGVGALLVFRRKAKL